MFFELFGWHTPTIEIEGEKELGIVAPTLRDVGGEVNCKLPPFHDGFVTISLLLKEKANADMEMYFMENSFPEFGRLEVSRDDEVFQIY